MGRDPAVGMDVLKSEHFAPLLGVPTGLTRSTTFGGLVSMSSEGWERLLERTLADPMCPLVGNPCRLGPKGISGPWPGMGT